MFHYTVDVSLTLIEVTEKLEEALKEEKFGVLWKLNLQDKLQEKGVNLDKRFVVLEVCNPKEAKRVLEEEILSGYFLPCKIVVYEDGGKTKIGLPKPTALINFLENEKLKGFAADIENRLIKCIDSILE